MRNIRHELALLRAGRAASSFAVAIGMRSFYPYDYRPDSRLIPTSFELAAHALREALVDLDSIELANYIPQELCDQLEPLRSTNRNFGQLQDYDAAIFSLLAVQLSPASALAWNTHGVSLLRQGRISCASKSLIQAERLSRSHLMKSRARANRAVLAELHGDLQGAEALATEAAAMPTPSPLAVFNSQLYHELMSQPRQED